MSAQRTAPAPPARGTRPRNRRALIIAAARGLFYERGYDQISMGDLADAVAIGPSALYRHFAGKQQLLREVVLDGIRVVREVLADHELSTDLGTELSTDGATLLKLATLSLAHRELGVLWQREARHTAPGDRAVLRAEVIRIGRLLAEKIRADRSELSAREADLLAWMTLAVLTSISFHHLELPRPEYEQLLAGLAGTVLRTDLPGSFGTAAARTRRSPPLLPHTRREALFSRAIQMFAQQGYTGVGIEDIGAAVGIAGPSVYNHFSSKLDLLVTAFHRGNAWLLMDLARALDTATDAADALRRLVHSYIDFATAHHGIIDLLITEQGNLPPDTRHQARQAQHDYISEWVHLLRDIHPGLDATVARIQVQAALTAVNDAARTPHLRRNLALPAALETICTRLLRLPPAG